MKRYFSTYFFIFIIATAVAQDVHFSQFFAAPLYYNPANTGNFSGSWRAGLNYRDQWGSVSVPYKTYNLYSDIAIQPKGALNRFGLGVLALNDVAGDGVLTTSRLQASAAYQIGFDENSDWRFSFGLSGAYVQKTIDIYKLTFDSQWSVDEFNLSLPNNETTVADKLNYLDFSAGGVLTFLPYDGEKYFLGISAAHINQPEESFYDNGNTLHIKYSASAGGVFPISGTANLSPQLFYAQQSGAMEFIMGSNVSVRMLNNDPEKYRALIVGAWYRLQDAAWFVAGMNFGDLTFSMNYDFNISQLTPASNMQGGLEFALVYTLHRKDKFTGIECPAYE